MEELIPQDLEIHTLASLIQRLLSEDDASLLNTRGDESRYNKFLVLAKTEDKFNIDEFARSIRELTTNDQ
jgi:hypothetical protein